MPSGTVCNGYHPNHKQTSKQVKEKKRILSYACQLLGRTKSRQVVDEFEISQGRQANGQPVPLQRRSQFNQAGILKHPTCIWRVVALTLTLLKELVQVPVLGSHLRSRRCRTVLVPRMALPW